MYKNSPPWAALAQAPPSLLPSCLPPSVSVCAPSLLFNTRIELPITLAMENTQLSCEMMMSIPVSLVEAWYFNPTDEDPKLPHKFTPNRPVPRQHLDELGMRIWRLDADKWEGNEMLEYIKKERGYNYWDIVSMAPSATDYEDKVKHFFTEHLHADEEIRFLLEGGGYWDIRDYDETWIRFRIEKGDLVVLPPGMYHRFTLDANTYVKAMRLFKGQPCWTQHERPADNMHARKLYMQNILEAGHAAHLEATPFSTCA